MVNRLVLCAAAILGLSLLLPAMTPTAPASFIREKKKAVLLAEDARKALGDKLLGIEYSSITTTVGHRDAKLLSLAPDFPALLVAWLREAGIGEGGAVAINTSGSFPALAIASLAAVRAIGARPLMISSLGASSWGANRPEYTWAHMEQDLRRTWPGYASIAMSMGGDGDDARDLTPEGRQALREALRLAGVPIIRIERDSDPVTARMRLWQNANQGRMPDALINIGGNQAFWGTQERGDLQPEGLWLPGATRADGDGVGTLFLDAGKPVIHLLGIKKLAARHGITIPPNENSPLWKTSTPSRTARCAIFLALLALLPILPKLVHGKA